MRSTPFILQLQDQPTNRPNIQPSVPRASFLLSNFFPIFLLLSSDSISNANPLGQRHLFLGPLIGATWVANPASSYIPNSPRPQSTGTWMSPEPKCLWCQMARLRVAANDAQSHGLDGGMGLGAVPLVNLRHSEYECLSMPPL
jgi:hypothetical protein